MTATSCQALWCLHGKRDQLTTLFCVNRFYPKTQLSWLARLGHSHCNSADPLTDGLEVHSFISPTATNSNPCRAVPGFVIFSENTPFSFLFSFSVEKFSGRKFSGSPSSTASIVVLLVQPAPEEEDLTKEGE